MTGERGCVSAPRQRESGVIDWVTVCDIGALRIKAHHDHLRRGDTLSPLSPTSEKEVGASRVALAPGVGARDNPLHSSLIPQARRGQEPSRLAKKPEDHIPGSTPTSNRSALISPECQPIGCHPGCAAGYYPLGLRMWNSGIPNLLPGRDFGYWIG